VISLFDIRDSYLLNAAKSKREVVAICGTVSAQIMTKVLQSMLEENLSGLANMRAAASANVPAIA
jgi:hypothetical protein